MSSKSKAKSWPFRNVRYWTGEPQVSHIVAGANGKFVKYGNGVLARRSEISQKLEAEFSPRGNGFVETDCKDLGNVRMHCSA